MEKKLTAGHTTCGQAALDLYCKVPDTLNVHELTQEQLTEYESNVQWCYNRGKKIYDGQEFYIVVLTKWERILGHKVLHPLFMPRRSCPTPEWDQTVYRCPRDSGEIEYLWTLPDKETYNQYLANPELVHPDEFQLLSFVLKDKNGELLALVKKLNGEIV